ncbi:MAG TPA: YkgJ family cysteine cluster protein [Myxococcota bacterium]|nr:YkgJ family cysteine cluster protein [Myxococcota bacterium]HOD08285.1 YkgJ family cysteine cluster protein [Myxococcota bacterium]HPB50944.1 YkgJ family cysteine cluster protein [Myxococcota bacterium]HQP95952.1 YkgJ family cysteine cluster protein [Myxococcota bacterium]
MIKTLHGTVDRFFEKAVEAAPDQFACRPGCASCCLVDLSVFEVEAALVSAVFATLPDDVRAAAADRAELGRHCCMIDDRTGGCIVYGARPIICRSHGLTILADGNLDHCPLNYTKTTADRKNILDIERLNTALVTVNAAAGHGPERVRLADIAIKNR